jgi:hypothetical protein
MTREQAIIAYTLTSAYAEFAEEKGDLWFPVNWLTWLFYRRIFFCSGSAITEYKKCFNNG